jgi:hypothetical protein
MSVFIHMQAISDIFKFFHLNNPVLHPLIAVVDFSQVNEQIDGNTKVSTDFYALICKNYNRNNVRYGRKPVDFQNGSLICLAPHQVLEMDSDEEASPELRGWGLFFHPDLIRATSLNDKMKDYNFFS